MYHEPRSVLRSYGNEPAGAPARQSHTGDD